MKTPSVRISFNDLMLRLILDSTPEQLKVLEKALEVEAPQGSFYGGTDRGDKGEILSVDIDPAFQQLRFSELGSGKSRETWKVSPESGTVEVASIGLVKNKVRVKVLPRFYSGSCEAEHFPGAIRREDLP